jgi:hypothetical protein
MKDSRTSHSKEVKLEIRSWRTTKEPQGAIDQRYFFAWKEGCLMGTCDTTRKGNKIPGVQEKGNQIQTSLIKPSKFTA